MRPALVLLVLLACAGQAHARSAQEAYEAGVAATRSGEHLQAAIDFTEALELGGEDAAVYHGLGNAWYRAGRRGEALAAWRRGQRLEPGNGDLSANIDHVRKAATDRLEPPDDARGPFFWLGAVSLQANTLAAAVLLGLALSLGALSTWRRRRQQAVGATVAGGLVLGLLGLLLAVASVVGLRGEQTAVVVDQAVTARSAMGPEGVDLFVLHELAEVRVLEEARGHVLVGLPDGRKGWLPEEAVVSTVPGASLPSADPSGDHSG